MKKLLPIIFLLLIAVLGIWALAQFSPQQDNGVDSTKMQIYSSILPIADLVEKIGGDFVQSHALVPVGASVHTYEPTPSQLRGIDSASLYVKVGTPVEFEVTWLEKLLSINPHLKVVDASSNITLMEFAEEDHDEHEEEDSESQDEHGHEGIDPHIWLSPKNVEKMVSTITDALIKELPEQQAYFETNKEQLLAELIILDGEIEQALDQFTKRELIVYHDAWGYFARDYALNLIVVEENQKEPTAKRLQDVIRLAKENKISAIFASPEFNTQSAETIAKEVGAEVVLISPLPEDLFVAFRQISDAFVTVLQQ